MGWKNKLKLPFVILILTSIVVICYFTFLIDEDKVGMNVVPKHSSILPYPDNFTFKYLWRPIREAGENVNHARHGNQSLDDRIGAQLQWTRNFFERISELQNIVPKKILLVFGKNHWPFWDTNSAVNCPGFTINSSLCELVRSKNLEEPWILPEIYDAVIYTQDYQQPWWGGVEFPKHVLQFIYELESPVRKDGKVRLSKYNLLASYYRGSDLVLPYSKWIPYDSEEAQYFNIKRESHKTNSVNYAEGKTKFAVMFSSNCNRVPNERLKYLKELQKFITVDLFGRCGKPLPCESFMRSNKCLSSLAKKYKFYFAFENSNCRDYITEKFFNNALNNDILPVALGAHPSDYNDAAPPNSFVHVDDFSSPKELAEYLITLDKNDTLYNEYFAWKGTGTFYNTWKDLFCRICGMTFYSTYVPPPIRDKDTTWTDVDFCLANGQWYWKNKNI